MQLREMQEMMLRGRQAQKVWRETRIEHRLQVIKQLRKNLIENQAQWVKLFVEETKKTPVDVLTTELLFTANACRFYEKQARQMLRPRRMPTPLQFMGQRSYVRYEPLGVIAIISPWNFPMQLSMVPAISALIAGNAVVLKASEYTPKINHELEKWMNESGLPPDLIQFVHGDGRLGEAVIDAGPDKVFFTGGGVAGKKVYERAARHMIPCDLELGGNDAMIVCHDAHLERAARAAVWGAFMHSGQVCISVERVYVHQRLYELFLLRITELTQSLQQGLSNEDDLGGMTTEAGWYKVKAMLEDAVSHGAIVHTGGLQPDAMPPFFPPTIISQVSEDMVVIKHEIFGPVLSVMSFEDEVDVVNRINESPLGLNAYIFTKNMSKAKRIAEQLDVGNIYINDVILNIGNMHLPFGGVKGSGFGRYHGAEGLYTFCSTKSIMIDRGFFPRQPHWFPYGKQTYSILRRVLKWLYG